jgi:hypothetical protein
MLEHIPPGWNQPGGICLLQRDGRGARFRSDGTASGSI